MDTRTLARLPRDESRGCAGQPALSLGALGESLECLYPLLGLFA